MGVVISDSGSRFHDTKVKILARTYPNVPIKPIQTNKLKGSKQDWNLHPSFQMKMIHNTKDLRAPVKDQGKLSTEQIQEQE